MEDLTIFILILFNGRLAILAAERLSEFFFEVIIDQLRIDLVVRSTYHTDHSQCCTYAHVWIYKK